MSADFWAGYISGAVGIIIGNPLDVLKVRLQAGLSPSGNTPSSSSIPPTATARVDATTPTRKTAISYLRPWITGTAAPVLGYGALNALLFVSYNRTEAALNQAFSGNNQSHPLSSSTSTTGTNLWSTWIAGGVGGLATWAVSTPTELIKCRVQLASSSSSSFIILPSSSPSSPSSPSSTRPLTSSWGMTKHVLRTEGVRGFYFGGLVTALRDSIGYGFYFWSYELSTRWMASYRGQNGIPASNDNQMSTAASVLLCGGLAGIVTWVSIFPLDVVKTRVQTQALGIFPLAATAATVHQQISPERSPLLTASSSLSDTHKTGAGARPLGAWEIANQTYRQGGVRPFFRGLGVCSVRAFIVNAVQWAVYEWIMAEMGVGRNVRNANSSSLGDETRIL